MGLVLSLNGRRVRWGLSITLDDGIRNRRFFYRLLRLVTLHLDSLRGQVELGWGGKEDAIEMRMKEKRGGLMRRR